MNSKPQYQTVNNVPIGCNFCGAQVQGRITEKKDPRTQQVIKECRWICSRCGNLSKIGNIS